MFLRLCFTQGRRQGIGGNGGEICDGYGTHSQRLLPPDGSSDDSEESQRPARCPFRSIQTNSRISQKVFTPFFPFIFLLTFKIIENNFLKFSWKAWNITLTSPNGWAEHFSDWWDIIEMKWYCINVKFNFFWFGISSGAACSSTMHKTKCSH